MKSIVQQTAATLAVLTLILLGCARSEEAKPDTEMPDTSMVSGSPATRTTAQSSDATPMLDGKRFMVEGGEQGKEKEAPADTLSFASGMFHSKACDMYGFGDGTYRAMQNGDATTFEATTTSEKEGTIDWKGTINGNMIEGTYRWTKAGQNPIDYWFKGTMM